MITVPPLDNGISTEVRRRLQEARTYQECANLGDDPAVEGLIAVDPEILKYELLTLLLDSGAYGMAQASNYNTRPRPAEVLVDGAEVKLIRRRETWKDLFAPEIL